MVNTDSIVQELFHITKDISDWKGGVLYSSKNTLKKGDFYLMGYNPGGSEKAETIKVDIENLKNRTENSYFDERVGAPMATNTKKANTASKKSSISF